MPIVLSSEATGEMPLRSVMPYGRGREVRSGICADEGDDDVIVVRQRPRMAWCYHVIGVLEGVPRGVGVGQRVGRGVHVCAREG